MLKRTIKFIHRLRIFFFLFILVSFLYYLGLNPVDVGRFVGSKIGSAVGMSISVSENPFNKLALQLKEREEGLDEREEALAVREIELNKQAQADNNPAIIFLLAGVAVLFFLIILNYYLDYRRRKKDKRQLA